MRSLPSFSQDEQALNVKTSNRFQQYTDEINALRDTPKTDDEYTTESAAVKDRYVEDVKRLRVDSGLPQYQPQSV